MQKIILSTNNKKKLAEMQLLLNELPIEAIPQSSLGIGIAEEPYDTFIENALAKARFASKATNLPAIADDSGLCVDALNGGPGIFSARFAGDPSNDYKNNLKLLQLLDGKKIEKPITIVPSFL